MSTNGQLVFTDVDKITFKGVGNTSNAVVDTVTGKIGVGIDSPDANLHVLGNSYVSTNLELGGTLIMGTVNVEAQHSLEAITATGNTTPLTVEFSNATTAFKATSNIELTSASKIIVDSNVVTEYTGPHDRPSAKYPEIILPRSAVGAEYNGYRIDRSSEHVTADYLGVQKLFNETAVDFKDTWGAGWQGTSGAYSTSTGEHSTYVTGGTTQGTGARLASNVPNGEWVSLKSPNAIKLDNIQIRSRNAGDWYGQFPTDFQIWGSNDGTTWSHVKTFTGQAAAAQSTLHTYIVNSAIFYNRHALVVTKIPGTASTIVVSTGHAHFSISELRFNANEEGGGSLDTTLKTVYNVPATTGTQLEVYYDAKGESTVQSPIPDLSPNTNTGAVSGHSPTLDSTDGIDSFKFNGSSQYVTGAHGLTTGSDPVHTISLWLNATEMTNYAYAVQLGQGGTSHQQSAIMFYENKISHAHWGSGVLSDVTLAKNVWYHVVAVFTGGNGSDLSKHKIFINGEDGRVGPFPGSTDGPVVLTGTQLTLGRKEHAGGTPGDYFNGSIANFRLYSKALNAGQVQELYDYQKDYFFGSKSQLTIYKGHLGIGVTEPSGQLELAGDERIQEYPPRAITVLNYHTHIEGHGEFDFSSNPSNYTGNTDWDLTKAFENTGRASVGWHGNSTSAPGAYQAVLQYAPAVTSGDGLVESILKDGSAVLGEWIQMHSPYAINVTRLATVPRTNYGNSRGIGKFAILGSNNGIDWEYAGNGAIAPYNPSSSTDAGGYGTRTSETIAHVSTNSNGHYYTYHRLVVTHIMGHRGASGHPNYSSGGSESVNQSYIRFYGTPDSTTLDKGSLSLTRSLDVPRISRYDVDTETPRPEKLVVDFDTTVNSRPTDISGKGNHGRFVNDATYSAPDKAFKFAAANAHIYLEQSAIAGTSATHTFSLWINALSAPGNGNYEAIFEGGVRSSNQAFGVYVYQDGSNTRVYYHVYGSNLPSNTSGYIINTNNWYHICGTLDNSGNVRRFYVNGELFASDTYGSLNVTHPRIRIGENVDGSETWHGMVSNFKLYNVALEPSEVRKLYNLGRTGRSMVISDTAVGIGKAPEAQLDVRGSIYSTRQEAQSMIVRSRKNASWASSHQPYDGKGFTIAKEENPLGEPGTDRYWQFNMHSNYNLHIGSNGRYTCYISQNAADQSLNFTGQHRCFIKDVPFTQAKELEGLVVSSDQNKYIKMNDGIEKGSNAITTNESLPIVSLSKTQSDKKCFGVISSAEDSEIRSDQYGVFNSIFVKEKGDTRVYINSVGEGAIWVANTNGSLEAGDYITTSNIAGYGQKQDGAGLMNYTVAKITMDCDFNPEPQPIQKIKKKQEITRYWRSSSGEESTEEKDGFDELVEKVEIVNDLDEHGQIQWEDHPTETEKAYKLRYLTVDGTQTDEANAVHTAAFVGCTYHCG